MHVRRTILCLAAAFLWATHDPDMASGQSSELMEAHKSYKTLYQQGRYAEAEPLYQRSLAIREKALGPEHSDVAQSLNNLAALYDAQGRYADAEPLHKRALAIWEEALGPDHPDVATSLENYAALLRKMSRDDEAVKLGARAKAIRAKHAEQNP